MVPDRQKMWTDGRKDGRNGRTHGRRQNYIPPTSSGDKKKNTLSELLFVSLTWTPLAKIPGSAHAHLHKAVLRMTRVICKLKYKSQRI